MGRMSRGYGYLLLLDRVGQVGDQWNTRKGRARESVVAIPRFLCGSPHLCQLRTASFWPRWQALSCVLTACRVLWGPVSRVAFVTTLSNRTSLLLVVLVLFRGGMRSRARTLSWEQGPDFYLVGTCEWLSYVRASWSQAYDV
jgi:hypothetical protein